MAVGCYGRRLLELLQVQQEPFLLHHGAATDAAPPCCSVARRRSALGRAVRRALRRWDDLAGCFPCAARESFLPLPHAGNTGGRHCGGVVTEFDDNGRGDDGGRRLSPVSILDVLRYYSHEESSSPTLSHWEVEDDDEPSSTSQPSGLLTDDDMTHAHTAEETMTTGSGKKSVEEEQKIIASWARIAGDIARVPALAELDLSSSGSGPEWERLGLQEASRRVGASIEAMIFEEVRAEAVRDMLEFPS